MALRGGWETFYGLEFYFDVQNFKCQSPHALTAQQIYRKHLTGKRRLFTLEPVWIEYKQCSFIIIDQSYLIYLGRISRGINTNTSRN